MARTNKSTRRNIDALYTGKSTAFKIFLLGGVVILSSVFIWYTFNVIDQLKEDTRSQVVKYVRMWQLAANSNMSGSELQFIFDEVIVKANFPIIVLNGERKPIHYRNVAGVEPGDTTRATAEYLEQVAMEMVEQNGDFPLVFSSQTDTFVNYFCYGDSKVINQLKVMPFIEIGIVVAFMLVAIIGFQNIRRSEERHIWVGMAKETAHQLGTPISSLMGWLEVLDTEKDSESFASEGRKLLEDTVSNTRVDVVRLRKVANRFGQIGSIPELKRHDLNEVIQETVEYFRRRLPFEGKGIRVDFTPEVIPDVNLNAELFSWALENLIKNSLQAVDSKSGRISLATDLPEPGKWVSIEIKDNGKGMPHRASRKIFQAGYTTKKRGWGLGLTLVKRIVEEYHNGRITLKKSKPGETVFEILIPVTGDNSKKKWHDRR
ncbi:MAG: HAMP domain-containing histidine kinase [Candidatus Zixiibacteriota bacterium]|nr:MAG: HAMP domain-containing histidine kinase [candidate division Zixibacteria bacterium]